jgi:hypothetical protein
MQGKKSRVYGLEHSELHRAYSEFALTLEVGPPEVSVRARFFDTL